MYRSLFLKGVVSLLLWTGSVPLFASSSAESQFLHPSMFQVVVQGSMYSNFGAETEGSRKSQSLYYQAEKSVLLSDVEQFSALLAQVIRDPSQVNSDVLQKFGFLIHRLISSDLEINATSQLQTLIEFNQRHGLFTHQADVQWLSANLHFLKGDLKALRKRVSASVGDIHVLAYISWLISRLDNKDQRGHLNENLRF